jgi:hypothetical protein
LKNIKEELAAESKSNTPKQGALLCSGKDKQLSDKREV